MSKDYPYIALFCNEISIMKIILYLNDHKRLKSKNL